jgi:hypothetical protein
MSSGAWVGLPPEVFGGCLADDLKLVAKLAKENMIWCFAASGGSGGWHSRAGGAVSGASGGQPPAVPRKVRRLGVLPPLASGGSRRFLG